MGANLPPFGATFPVWAPTASSVNVRSYFSDWGDRTRAREEGGSWACQTNVAARAERR